MASPGLHQPIIVRAMTADDIPSIARWVAAIPLWQRYGLSAAKAQALLRDALTNGDRLLVADAPPPNGKASGLAWCLEKGAFGRSPYLRLLGVRADLAGHGIGGILLDTLERHLAKTASELFLLVSDFNTAAQAFYRRHGYAQVGAIDSYVLSGVAELIFWKRLPPSSE